MFGLIELLIQLLLAWFGWDGILAALQGVLRWPG